MAREPSLAPGSGPCLREGEGLEVSLISNSQWFPRPHLPAEPPLDPLKDGVPRPSQLVTVQGCWEGVSGSGRVPPRGELGGGAWEGVPGSGRVPSRPTSTLLVMFLLTTPMPGSVKAISAWLSADPALSNTVRALRPRFHSVLGRAARRSCCSRNPAGGCGPSCRKWRAGDTGGEGLAHGRRTPRAQV